MSNSVMYDPSAIKTFNLSLMIFELQINHEKWHLHLMTTGIHLKLPGHFFDLFKMQIFFQWNICI